MNDPLAATPPAIPVTIFLVGPTGVGKTEASIYLARRINAEVVSADSMLVYRGMDIGTAKPTVEQQAAVRHHLIDIIEPTEEFSVGKYRELAQGAIGDIHSKSRVALVCGGTGLYIRSLVDGLFEGPEADWELRRRLSDKAKAEGPEALHGHLAGVDPEAAKKLSPRDVRRVIRALEVHQKTHRPISEFQSQWRQKRRGPIMFGLLMDRAALYARLDDRVEEMFRRGLVHETQRLLEKGLRDNRTALQAIGYKEVIGHLDGRYSLDEAKELLKRNTRRYAKRQLTWFRKDDRIQWYSYNDYQTREGLYAAILDHLRGPTWDSGQAPYRLS